MTEFTSDDLDSLAAKLDALALTEGERAALDAVFDAAAGPEVSAFAFGHEHQSPFRSRLGAVLLFDEADSLFGTRSSYIGETEKNLPPR